MLGVITGHTPRLIMIKSGMRKAPILLTGWGGHLPSIWLIAFSLQNQQRALFTAHNTTCMHYNVPAVPRLFRGEKTT